MPTTPPAPQLDPGRMVSLIHAAILAAEQEPSSIEVEYDYPTRTVRRVNVQLAGTSAYVAAFAVLMHLGDGRVAFKPFEQDPRYGYLSGLCDRLDNTEVRILALTATTTPTR